MSRTGPMLFAVRCATALALIPFAPWLIAFAVMKAPPEVQNLTRYTAVLFAIGSPGSDLLDHAWPSGVGWKFGVGASLINWLIYFVLCYLAAWSWVTGKYIRARNLELRRGK